MKLFRFIHLIIFFLISFMSLGLTSRSVAVDCNQWDFTVYYYTNATARQAAFNAAADTSSFTYFSNSTSWLYLCYGVSSGLSAIGKYHTQVVSGVSVSVGKVFVLDGSCPDGEDNDGHCECQREKQVLSQQCGGSDKYVIDEATCQGYCTDNCSDERAALEEQCGGPDSYDFDETWCVGRCKNSCREKARAACHDQPMSGSSNGPYDPMSNTKWFEDGSGMCKYECKCPNYDGSVPYNQYDFETCQPIPPGGACSDKLEEARQKCPFKELATANYETCESTCKTCATRRVECAAKCPDGGKLYDCDDYDKEEGVCLCADQDCMQMRDVCEVNCRDRGGIAVYNCDAEDYTCTCKYDLGDCNTLKQQCVEKCADKGGVKENNCYEVDGKVREAYCDCVEGSTIPELPPLEDNLPQTCDDLRAKCNPSCNFSCVSGPGGYADPSSYKCDCSGPSDDPDDGGDDGPSDDPSDDGDGNGWLKSIKENTDTLIGQGNDVKGWLSSIKENSDKIMGLDSQRNESLEGILGGVNTMISSQGILDKNMSKYSKNEIASVLEVEKDVENTNVLIGGKGGTNELIADSNKNLNDIKGNIFGIKEGLSNLSIGTGVGTGTEVTEGNYGEGPTDSDLPSKESMNSAFGTYTPSVDSNRDLIKNTISGFIPGVGSSECNISISLPVPSLSGLVWHDYPLNFCQYEEIFVMIGNALVFLTALYELYSLA